jgi:hypothetical protein
MDNNAPSFPATLVAVIDSFKVVINRGTTDNVKVGQRFLVYSVSKEPILDPETGEDLGQLEIVKGTGKVVHVQDRMATLHSDNLGPTGRTLRRFNTSALAMLSGARQEEEVVNAPESLPFDGAVLGDKAKPV